MKKLKINSIGLLVVALLLSLSINSMAQNQRGNSQRNGQSNDNETGYFCNNLTDLTADQQTKISELRTAHLKDMLNNRNQLAENRAHLKTLRSADNADMGAINKTIDEIGAIQIKMQKNREQHFQNIRGLLTDDQRVNFDNSDRGPGNGHCNGNGNNRGKGMGYNKGNKSCYRNM